MGSVRVSVCVWGIRARVRVCVCVKGWGGGVVGLACMENETPAWETKNAGGWMGG